MYLAVHNGAFELMHDLDLALWYAGQPVKKLHCVYGTYSDIGIQSPDVVEFLLGFRGSLHGQRASGLLPAAAAAADGVDRHAKASSRWNSPAGIAAPYRCTRRRAAQWKIEELTTDRDDMFRAEDREFLEAVADDKPIRCTVAEGRKSLEAVCIAQQGGVDAR